MVSERRNKELGCAGKNLHLLCCEFLLFLKRLKVKCPGSWEVYLQIKAEVHVFADVKILTELIQ